MPETDGLS